MWASFVTNWEQAWLLYNQAKSWNKTPAELLSVEDAYLAYCVNNSIYAFGTALDAELESVTGKKKEEVARKRSRIVDKWLERPLKFRNPMATTTREGTA